MNDRDSKNIANFLTTLELFKSMDSSILEELCLELTMITLDGGETLMKQDELGDSLYVLRHGRLRASAHLPNGSEITIGEIAQGEMVGEIALLVNEPRTATVKAIRDSILIKLSKEVYDKFVQKYPESMMEIARTCVRRLLAKSRAKQTSSKVQTIAILPAGKNPALSSFVTELTQYFKKYDGTLRLNSTLFDSLYKGNLSQAPHDSSQNLEAVALLQEAESKYPYVIYEADSSLTHWTKRCIRQADRVIFVGLYGKDSDINEIEENFISEKRHLSVVTEFVLLHDESYKKPNDSMQLWLKKRPIKQYHHLDFYSKEDYAKLTRYLTGNAFGLVLSGGGARGLAHVGVIRALEEHGIKVDICGGSSMGAIIAGGLAMGMDWKTMIQGVEKNIVRHSGNFDFTLPLLSIKTGKYVTLGLRETFGDDTLIEDLWGRFFCVSTNLSQGHIKIHERGVLWKAVRASLSLPAIFPPVMDEHGCLLIDGAIINNMPVDVLQQRINGGKIMAVSLSGAPARTNFLKLDSWMSGWKLLGRRLNPFETKKEIPHLGEIIMDTMMLAGSQHQEMMKKQANFNIEMDLTHFDPLNFKAYQHIVDAGYDSASKQVDELLKGYKQI